MQKLLCRHLIAVLGISGCATSFAPPETTVPLTNGPPAIAIVDSEDVRLEQLFIRGLTRALVDDHKQAIFLFEQAIQLDAGKPAILMALAESHAALDELDAAIYYATDAVSLDHQNRSYTIYLGDLLRRKGNGEESLSLLKGWLADHPEDIETHFEVADLLADLGRQQEALDVYLDLVRDQGDEVEIRYRMLELYNGLGDIQGMRSTLLRLLSIDPSDNSLRHLLSEVYVDLDSTDAAIEVLEEAVAENPTDAGTTLQLAKLYRSAGRKDEAAELVRSSSIGTGINPADRMTLAADLYARSSSDEVAGQRAEEILGDIVKEGNETPEVLFMLGDLRYRNAEYLSAAPLLVRSAEAEPRRLDAWSKAALSFLKGGASEEALSVAEEALVLFPGNYSLLRAAGQASLRTNRPEQAIQFASDAIDTIRIEDDPSPERETEMLLLTASAYRLLGVPEGAEKALRDLLKVSPDDKEAAYWLVLSLLDQDGRHEEARTLTETLLTRDHDDTMFLDAMGWVEHVAGDDQSALNWLDRSVSVRPDDPWSQEHLGDVYSALGNLDAARSHWQKALDLQPNRVTLRAKLEQHQ